MITGITPEIKEAVELLIRTKLVQFWNDSPDELWVCLDEPDGVASLAEQACCWMSGEFEKIGTELATQ